MKYCYFNGKIMPQNETHISLNDLGFLRSYAIFEILRTYSGKPFLLDEHFARFEKSAETLHLKKPFSKNELGEIIAGLLKKNEAADAMIKIILTGGESEDGMKCDYENPNLYILLKNLPKYPEEIYEQGVKLDTFEHKRELPGVKTNNYLTMVNLQKARAESGARETLYIKHGRVLEGATSNFFIFRDNILITPKKNILMGTTRNFIIKLAKEKFSVQERDLSFDEAKEADEAFITSATREIWPVVKIDNFKIGDGKVGKNTKILMNLFREYTEKY